MHTSGEAKAQLAHAPPVDYLCNCEPHSGHAGSRHIKQKQPTMVFDGYKTDCPQKMQHTHTALSTKDATHIQHCCGVMDVKFNLDDSILLLPQKRNKTNKNKGLGDMLSPNPEATGCHTLQADTDIFTVTPCRQTPMLISLLQKQQREVQLEVQQH